jgi:hypothetical protein
MVTSWAKSLGVLVGCVAVAVVGTALGGVDLTVRSGDKVSSTLDAGGEVERYRFTCPAGALVTVKAKAAKKGPPLRVRVVAPNLVDVGEATGTAATVKGALTTSSGIHTAEISADDGATGTEYSVTVSWKNPKKYGFTPQLDPGGQSELAFSGEAGATATLSVKKAKRSAAVPVVLSLAGPQGDVAIVQGASVTVVLPETGDYTMFFGDTGTAGGQVAASIKVKTPKTVKRTAILGASGTPAGTALELSRTIGPAGGTAAADVDGPISGASVTVPAGALTQATSILIGTTSVIATAAPGISAGPAIFFGPEGLSFAPEQAQVTIPYDASFFEGGTSDLRVYTRAADGSIEEITEFTIDSFAATVTFAVSHFSTFEVRRAFRFVERPILTNPAGTTRLGFSAAVGGDRAAFGVPFHDPTGINQSAGGLAIHHRNADGTWTSDGMLTTPNFQSNDQLGVSVAIDGDTLVGGAPLRTPAVERTGAAEVWRRDVGGVWQFEAELVPTNGLFGWEAGNAVAIDGDTAVVAAHGDSENASLAGAVHVFVRSGTTWTFQQRLTEASPVASGRFGGSVAIEGDTIVVGSFKHTARPGFVQVFHRTGTTWSRDGRIEAANGFANDSFGTSVSISGGLIAVGAPTLAADGSGEVYVYRDQGTSFPLDAFIPSNDPTQVPDTSDSFGNSVSLRGSVLVVGAPLQTVQIKPSSGQVFIYESPKPGTWLVSARLRGYPGEVTPSGSGDKFGTVIAFDGETIVSGAPDASFGVGNAYAFDLR